MQDIEEIAVIGMAGRFPGAPDLDAFWRNLRAGVESIRFFSDRELLAAGTDPSWLDNPRYVRARGALGGVEMFDSSFFDFTPRDAETADPQQRILLECAWEALETSGYAPRSFQGLIGIFAGASRSAYLEAISSLRSLRASLGRLQVEIGSDRDHLAPRIAYKLDLRGPALTVQAGCSTSLVAVHLAVQALLSYECDLALAGGVSISLPEAQGYLYEEGGIASPDGHCRAFDRDARGTVSGNGAGLVVLKRLTEAIADGDTIRAVIKGSAVNNDGAAKPGYTAPSVTGQARAIRAALAMARCQPRDISYIEAHGTGTPVGDPVEVAALRKAFDSDSGETGWCALGSVKTNVGHLNAAAGIAGLIKTVLMLENREIVPSLHFEASNPEIDFERSPFRVSGALRQWTGSPLRVGVSSFSIGGTNAHVILEEAPPPLPVASARPLQLLLLSARTTTALEAATARLANELERRPDLDLADVAFTLQSGREPFRHRRALVAATASEAASLLRSDDLERVVTGMAGNGYRPVAFLFPGQGGGHLAMGRRLYETEPAFRQEVDRCAGVLESHLGIDPRICLASGEAAGRLRETAFSQPFLFMLEIALARLWMGWGIRPEAMLGHSIGEYAAACLAGVFELEEALELVAVRGRLLQSLPKGAMLAVALPEEELRVYLSDGLSLAAVNGPANCVLSGPVEAIATAEARLTESGAACRRLATDRAFHSSAVEPAMEELTRRIGAMRLSPPRIPFISNLTGTWIRDGEATEPDYWRRHLRETVLFSRGLEELWRTPGLVLLEAGPGQALTRLARSHPACGSGLALASTASGPEDEEDAFLLATLGRLWLAGVEVDWNAFHAGARRRRIPLPTYPFERRRHWLAALDPQAAVVAQPQAVPAASPVAQAASGGEDTAREERFPSAPYEAPESEEERAIVGLLQELFGFDRVGIDDDFFDLGGHSLMAVQAVNRLRLLLAVDLSLGSLFEHPTARGLAREIVELRSARPVPALDFKPLNRGKVEAPAAWAIPDTGASTGRRLRFSLFFFSADGETTSAAKYRLLLESARFADQHGFEAVWTPERHFQRFGGLYPNPSVLSAALVAVTQRVEIRAGSLVLPLHNPIRVAEDWAVLDNLSGGRVGLSVASGWHPGDFALAPDAYADRKRHLFEGVDLLRRLWSGETLELRGGDGQAVQVTLQPRPLRPELPIWVTSSGSLETWTRAGEIGANVLTGFHDDLAQRVAHYRRTRKVHGHDPDAGRVTVMLHTYVCADPAGLEETVRTPLTRYLRSFAEQSGPLRSGGAVPTGKELDDMAAFRFEKLLREGSLLGSLETCARRIAHLEDCGVDEVACLVDFGLDDAAVLSGLENLAGLLGAAGRTASTNAPGPDSPREKIGEEIQRRSGEGPWPLTFEQERLWMMQQLFADGAAYNIGCSLRFSGPFDPGALRLALDELVRRHEILRTRFFAVDGWPVQEPLPPYAVPLPVVDLEAVRGAWNRAGLEREMGYLARQPFDLESGLPLRAILLRVDGTEHVVFITLHHIASDWWSFEILRRELRTLYGAFLRGEASPLPTLPIQYADFAVWLRGRLQGEALERHLAYWRKALANAPALLALQTDRPRPPAARFRGARHWFSIEGALSDALRKLGHSQDVTPFSVLLAGLFALLHRYTGQEDLLVGTPVADRPSAATEKLIGYFLNMLVLRADLAGDPSFRDLLGRVRRRVVGALAHPHLPLRQILEELRLERPLGHATLFQVSYIYLQTADRSATGTAVTGGDNDLDPGVARFDLTFVVEDRPGSFLCFFEYDSDLFDPATVTRMEGHLRSLLSAATADSAAVLSGLPLLMEGERHQLLNEWNDTRAEYPPSRCLHELFEEQVRRTPEVVAVTGGGLQLTYVELDRQAERLARKLQALGAGPEWRVGIFAERSLGTVAALLGILKAGAAFVPLDPSYPVERLSYIMEDAEISILMTQRSLLGDLPGHGTAVLCIDDEPVQAEGEEEQAVAPVNIPVAALAYVIYTSGSTGRPKGVQVHHRGVVNCLASMARRPGLTAEDVLVSVTTLAFDIAVLELCLPLLVGARIVFADRETVANGGALLRLLADSGATVLQATPATWRLLLASGWRGEPRLRAALCGGEVLPRELANELLARAVEVWNVYGPTETTIWSSCHRVESMGELSGSVSIGRPIAGLRILVLDSGFWPVPVGLIGEICIGGTGVSRGYSGRPDLTAERFVPDPFAGQPGGRLYRTGDLARLRPRGEVEYLGRLDHQVKIRGFRIELGEIEAVLESHPAVRQAVVLAREEAGGDRRLVAYVVGEAGEGLREHLRAMLPDYMVPSMFVALEFLPLTPNGKVDRRALAAIKPLARTGQEVRPPRTPTEELVAGIFAELLDLDLVGMETHFFTSGGHSLLATQAMARLQKAFGVELPLRALFEAPTVQALAEQVEKARLAGDATVQPLLERVPRGEPLPLSFAQQRLWFLAQLEPDSPAYNMPRPVRLEGPLDVAALAKTLSELIRRHEALRTRFEEIGGEPRQVIEAPRPLTLPRVDLDGLEEGLRTTEARLLAAEEAARPFDLSRGPVLRAGLLRLAATEHVLLLTLHHIVSDGWSMDVMVRELTALYDAFSEGRPSPLPELPIQYADFAVWQRCWLQGESLERQLGYWRRQLASAPPPTRLPFRYEPAGPVSARGGSCSFTLLSGVAEALRRLARQEKVTLYMTLLAGFEALLYRATGQTDLIIGTDLANRRLLEVEGLIGFFVNVLPMRVSTVGQPEFRELLARVREAALSVYAHQDVPLEKIVEEMAPGRGQGRSAFFEMLFVYLPPIGEARAAGLRLSRFEMEYETSRFDLALYMSESAGQVRGTFSYLSELFAAADIEILADHFQVLLANAAERPETRLDGLDWLTDQERMERDMELESQEQASFAKFKRIKPQAVTVLQ